MTFSSHFAEDLLLHVKSPPSPPYAKLFSMQVNRQALGRSQAGAALSNLEGGTVPLLDRTKNKAATELRSTAMYASRSLGCCSKEVFHHLP